MNSGKLNVYITFCHAGAWICFHSVTVVMPPMTSSVR